MELRSTFVQSTKANGDQLQPKAMENTFSKYLHLSKICFNCSSMNIRVEDTATIYSNIKSCMYCIETFLKYLFNKYFSEEGRIGSSPCHHQVTCLTYHYFRENCHKHKIPAHPIWELLDRHGETVQQPSSASGKFPKKA